MKYAFQRLGQAMGIALLGASVAACGGGGGSVSSAPPAPPNAPEPEPPTNIVELLDAPATQEFKTFTTGDADNQVRVRYDAQTDRYDIMLPGRDWDQLIDDPNTSSPGPGNPNLVPASKAGVNEAGIYIFTSHRDPYDPQFHYSNLLTWHVTEGPDGAPASQGVTVLGVETPASGIPRTGSATYNGYIRGSASIIAKSGWGDQDPAPVDGSVSLGFDFAKGTLAGQMKPMVGCDCDPIDFPTLQFTDTVFGVGSQTFSGRFATTVAGPNAFAGLFTGPNAEELIGKWAFPFLFEGKAETASGVWLAAQD